MRSYAKILSQFKFTLNNKSSFNLKTNRISIHWILRTILYKRSKVLVKLIGVNKGRRVTLKYFSILINVSRKHKLFIGPGQKLSLIFIIF